ncbi:MAG: DUF420 domain-containing protein [Pirellulales bacterium]
MDAAVEYLPAVNATLNALATVLLVTGWVLIKRGNIQAHKRTMLTAFGVSCAFLACYLTYHYALQARYGVAGVAFQGPPHVRTAYLTLLASHVILAATVPFLAAGTIYLGLRDERRRHRRLARWTLPIWLYVSVTGVIVYLLLYHIYPSAPAAADLIIELPAPREADVVR